MLGPGAKLYAHRRTLRNVILVSFLASLGYAVLDSRWYIPAVPSLVILTTILVVICWSTMLWTLADAFHPEEGWLCPDSRLALNFPWLRYVLIVVLVTLFLLPALVWLLAYS